MDPAGSTPRELPATIGRYRILARLSARRDDVFKGFDPNIERHLVVKVFSLRDLDPPVANVIRQTFFSEMQRTGMLAHPGITALFDAGEWPDGLFMATEFVEGASLAEQLEAVLALPLPKRVSLVVQLAAALEYARAQGVPHLHLRPSNVLIAADFTAKIRGFGVASVEDALGSPAGRTPTSSIGAAPERLAGERGDARSDVFSLARIAQEVLGDAVAAGGAGPADVFRKALAPAAEDRYQTADAFKFALLLSLGLDEGEVRLAWETTREAGNILAADRAAPALPQSAVNRDLTALAADTPTQLTPSGVDDLMTILGTRSKGTEPAKPA